MKRLLVVCLVLVLTLSFASPLMLVAAEPRVHGSGGVYLDEINLGVQARGAGHWTTISYCSLRGQWWHSLAVETMSVRTIATTSRTYSLASATNGRGLTIRGPWEPTGRESSVWHREATPTGNRVNWQLTN